MSLSFFSCGSVPRTGIEPARLVKGHWILSPACLPISASRHTDILHQDRQIAATCLIQLLISSSVDVCGIFP